MAKKRQVRDLSAVEAGRDEFVQVADAVQLTRTSRPTIERRIRDGSLRKYRFGRRVLLRKSDLLALVKLQQRRSC